MALPKILICQKYLNLFPAFLDLRSSWGLLEALPKILLGRIVLALKAGFMTPKQLCSSGGTASKLLGRFFLVLLSALFDPKKLGGLLEAAPK